MKGTQGVRSSRMRASRWCAALIVLFVSVPATAQVSVGDVVTLRERHNNIPAHPAPGDNHVPFRFESGSQATILDIDNATTWVRVQGVDTNQTAGVTGWITQGYIDSVVSGGGSDIVTDSLSWCPEKGSPNPHPSGRLRLATWNLGNLHAENGQSIFPDSVRRDDDDYLRLRCYIRLFDPDILAVQEVDRDDALQRVVDTDVYEIHVSSRNQNGSGQQNTGFAYRKGLNVTTQTDLFQPPQWPHAEADERPPQERMLLEQQLRRSLQHAGRSGPSSRDMDRQRGERHRAFRAPRRLQSTLQRARRHGFNKVCMNNEPPGPWRP